MNPFKPLLVFVATVTFLTSCQSFYTTDTGGTASIRANGYRLPATIGRFKRVYITAFDNSGHNLGAGYNYYSEENQVALTVYVLSASHSKAPTASHQQQYFQASRQEVAAAHKNSIEVGSTEVGGHGSSGRLCEFRYNEVFANSPQRVASFLAVFTDGNCLIKYRITGPEAQRDKIYASLVEAIEALSKIN